MIEHSNLPALAPSRLAAVRDRFVSGARRLATRLATRGRRKFRVPETPADLMAYNDGFDAGIHSAPLSDCPYIGEGQAEMWRKGWHSGQSQAW